MNFKEYQEAALETAIFPGQGELLGITYTALGLGEVGEVQGKIKKVIRDNNSVFTEDNRKELGKELGDVLWYVAALADQIGLSLNEIAENNISKLKSRQERGVLQGSGDNR